MSTSKNYAGISDEFAQLEKSKIILIPVPYDGTSTWGKGADKGPEAFLEASENMELYDIETDSEVYKQGIHLTEPIKMKSWLTNYDIMLVKQKIIGLIMAGNVPLVGFHDLMCVLLSGHKAVIKLSSQDLFLMQWIIQKICKIEIDHPDRLTLRLILDLNS